ncbi:DUF5070 domain-containing protein [Candidatus Chlamydia sanziniae]|uniref:Uncharacterized protein n=1 Tax=Candidatus Chlamydia sanziniae TaxID=1806891 RepID=A0A1A9HVW6_9CHLA|nr:DUF5070 domain-containing protein [Candidatus Chlamydia sanziniae]ANH78184.1 hypothetical protein Cs308_0008 [Candidatus Chlamydia sanziniae]
MRFALHLEHLRHFQNHGSILFEALLTKYDCLELEVKLRNFVSKVSKNTQDIRWRGNLFRSIPEISLMIHKRQLSSFAAEFVHRPKLSLVRDLWVFSHEEVLEGEEDCTLFLSLSGASMGSGVFFVGPYPTDLCRLEPKATGLLLAFSSIGHPIV